METTSTRYNNNKNNNNNSNKKKCKIETVRNIILLTLFIRLSRIF